MGQYSRVPSPYGGPGRFTNPGMIAAMRTYCAIVGIPLSAIYCIQGSFNTGVKASAGTHDGPDCLDVDGRVDEFIMKLIGLLAWFRDWPGNQHTHLLRLYSRALAWLAAAQARAWIERGTDGTGSLNHPDTQRSPRYRTIRHISGPTDSRYVVKRATYSANQPGGHPGDRRTKLKPGTQLGRICGVVKCRGRKYLVTAVDHRPVFTRLSDCARLDGRGRKFAKPVTYRVVTKSAPARPAPFKATPPIPGWALEHGKTFRSDRAFADFRRSVETKRWVHVSHLDRVKG